MLRETPSAPRGSLLAVGAEKPDASWRLRNGRFASGDKRATIAQAKLSVDEPYRNSTIADDQKNNIPY